MSQLCSFEIVGRFDSESDSHRLLYAPVEHPWTFRQTRLYQFEIEGDASALEAFVDKVLLDPISQERQDGAEHAFPEAAFVLEYGMKGGALDHEKETILAYHSGLDQPGFTIQKLTLRTRVYVSGEGAESEPFVRDVCNPAIHNWEVKSLAA